MKKLSESEIDLSSPTAPPSPPSVKGSPFLGSAREFRQRPIGFFTDILADHGDVVHFKIGPRNVVIARHPTDVTRVLQDNHTAYGKQTLGFKKLGLLLGQGLVTSDGSFWLRQRRIAQPAFHRERVAGFADTMVKRGQQMLDAMEAESQPAANAAAADDAIAIDLAPHFGKCAMEIAGDTLLSVDMSGEAQNVADALSVVLPYLNRLILNPLPMAHKWPTPRNFAFRKSAQDLDNVVNGVIEDRRRQAKTRDEGGADLPNDLLTMLMDARTDDGESMTDVQLRDEVMTMFLAGHETTANALAWATALVLLHPEWKAKLETEVRSVLADGSRVRAPKLGDLQKLEILDRIAKEALRLYPPGWLIGRSIERDDVLGGKRIDAGGVLFVSPYFTHRHPDFWEDPEAFDPDRFLPEREQARPKGAYIPFVAGPRQCIGKPFAEMELRLLLALLFSQFDVEMAPGHRPVPDSAVTLRPSGGVLATLRRRPIEKTNAL